MSNNETNPSGSFQLFIAGLANLDATEAKKVKELYIRNEIAEYQAEVRSGQNDKVSAALHMLIPIFWPMLLGARREHKNRLQERKDKINNALQIWKDDLSGSYEELYALLHSN